LAGATVYVTLEPCSHHGRTPPCCDALTVAGVGRVEVALQDPNPLVAGQGLARLRAAGVRVNLLDAHHPVAQTHRELNIGFFNRMLHGKPWVRLKMAASLDGTTALHNGQSQWITSEAARRDGHAWRKRAGALLTGIGTVLEDDPRLDVRLVETPVQPVRVVVDSRLDMPPTARILQEPGAAWIYTSAVASDKSVLLSDLGCTVVHCPATPSGKVDLNWLLQDLAQRGVNELHLEAGHKLNGSFLRENLVDELLLYLAPKLLGPGAGLAHIGPFDQLTQALNWVYTDIAQPLAERRRHDPLGQKPSHTHAPGCFAQLRGLAAHEKSALAHLARLPGRTPACGVESWLAGSAGCAPGGGRRRASAAQPHPLPGGVASLLLARFAPRTRHSIPRERGAPR
jgi:diaminohydroxyphosphoribosylaminopyrimidine deaminase/5-amino-6-(5-phosphoribosylamino)uracil reductase